MSLQRMILIAEDDLDDRYLFNEAMSASKDLSAYELSFTDNGQQLLHGLSALEGLPAAIFLDVNMPIMNGLECLQALRERHSKSELPIIMISTSNDNFNIGQAWEGGANRYLVKPFEFDELQRLLDQVLVTDGRHFLPTRMDDFVLVA